MIKLFKVNENLNLKSKQLQEDKESLFSSRDGVLEPNIDFEILLYTYESSSIISWIIKKITNSFNVWFQENKNKELNIFLQKLDIVWIITNILIFWNSFYERLTDISWNLTNDFEKIITPTVRLANKNNENVFCYQRSKKGLTKVPFMENEILFFKNNSVSSRHYWDSLFYTCIDEIVLLWFITKYYKNFFKWWNIEPNVLYDESWNLTEEQIEKIENLINDKIAWIDNSHNTVFAPWKIWKIDLITKIEPEKFIALKRELKEDIAIATNIPFSLLSPENSNKAISETDINTLYSDIILPLQNSFLIQLKNQLKKWKIKNISDNDIDEIKFNTVNLKDWLKEMEILTWYQKMGCLSVNEVRTKAELGEKIKKWWDEYIMSNNSNITKDNANLTKIEKEIKKIYNKKYE